MRKRRTPWPASRSGRSRVRPRSPANDAGRRASRRSTAAFRETEISLQLRAGLPGAGIGAGPVQQAPCRAVLVPPGRGPGAARVRGYEPRPQGPHPVPLSRRLMKTPSSGQDIWNIVQERNNVKNLQPCVFEKARWVCGRRCRRRVPAPMSRCGAPTPHRRRHFSPCVFRLQQTQL